LILDGGAGKVISDPDPMTILEYEQRGSRATDDRQGALHAALDPAITKDGCRVEVCANIGHVSEAEAALRNGAEGVGLLRTEFLYLDRASAPDEEEQVQAYKAIAQVFDQRPLVIRTLDIGGDKVLPYMPMQAEDNPFLGLRGIRLCLSKGELFSIQMRAVLRAAYGHNIKIMFPMVATVEEVREAKALLSEARTRLAS